LPHLFITINPADVYNPVSQFLGGRDINLAQFFHNLSPNSETFDRAKLIAENPVAGAKAFKLLIDGFLQIILGYGLPGKCGIFGPVDSYMV